MSTIFPSTCSPQTTLRIYRGETSGGDDSPACWTVREAFQRRVKPKLVRLGRSPATMAKWLIAVNYWEILCPRNPPIRAITGEDLTEFCDRLISRIETIRTNGTANQKMMHVQSILKACADVFPGGCPAGTPLPEQAATKHRRIVPDDRLNAMYLNCELATLSRRRDLPAPVIWRALLALFSSVGCRRGEGCLMARSAWRRAPEFPEFPEHPDFEIDAESPHGWLVFHTPKTRARKQGRPLVLPVSAMLAKHLDALDRHAPDRERMFPIGDHPTSWQGQLDRLQWGVKTTRGNKESITGGYCYCFQDLRKTVNRRFRKHAGREIARYFLGHQPRGVNARYYDDLTEDAVEAVRTISWPSALID